MPQCQTSCPHVVPLILACCCEGRFPPYLLLLCVVFLKGCGTLHWLPTRLVNHTNRSHQQRKESSTLLMLPCKVLRAVFALSAGRGWWPCSADTVLVCVFMAVVVPCHPVQNSPRISVNCLTWCVHLAVPSHRL